MKTPKLILGLVCVMAISVSGCSTQPVRTADITERGMSRADFPTVKQLAPNVYAYTDWVDTGGVDFTTTSLIVVTSEGVVIVDGQDTEEQGRTMVKKIKEITPLPVKYAVIASPHGDHVNSNPALKEAWPDVVFISSSFSLFFLKGRNSPILPTELVKEKRSLHLGGTEIQILDIGRGHSGGDLVAYLPESKVLFLGELYMHYMFPGFGAGFPTEHVETLKKAQAMDVKWFVPGHGFIDDPASLKSNLDEYRQAVEYTIAEGKRLHAAGHKCASTKECPAVEAGNWGEYKDWTLFPYMIPRNLQRVYAEIEGRML